MFISRPFTLTICYRLPS